LFLVGLVVLCVFMLLCTVFGAMKGDNDDGDDDYDDIKLISYFT